MAGGAFIGDRGSALQLVRKVLRHMARLHDAGQTCELGENLIEHLQLASLAELQGWFDQKVRESTTEWPIQTAKLARFIVGAADGTSDEVAQSFVRTVAARMADTILLARDRFSPISKEFPVVLQGWLFEHSNLYRETVQHILDEKASILATMSAARPLVGAVMVSFLDTKSALENEELQTVERALGSTTPEYRKLLYY